MSTAYCQMLPREFTDTTMKTIFGDDILSKGSLILLDPTNPILSWGAGVPVADDRLPNLADVTAARLIAGDLRPQLKLEASMASGSFIERTQKGGLRVGVSSGQTKLSGANIVMPDPILQYMLAHQDHEYYFSMWSYVTQSAQSTSTDEPHMHIYRSLQSNGYPTGGVVSLSALGNWERPDGASKTGGYVNNANGVGPQFRNIAGHINGKKNAAGEVLSMTEFTLNKQKSLVSLGPANDESAYTATTASSGGLRLQSWNMYRVYIEDLTVSERSYASVHAIDQALYIKNVVSNGGRYYNDSWSPNPA